MKPCLLALFAVLLLTGCAFDPLNPTSSLQRYSPKLGYENREFIKLRGHHILEVIDRGVGFVDVSTVLDDMNLYYLASSCRSWGSGAVTTTYRVFLDGRREFAGQSVDYHAACNIIYLQTDKDGVIIDYVEQGSEVQEIPEYVKQALFDIIGA